MSPDVPLLAFMTRGTALENIMHMDLSENDEPDMSQGPSSPKQTSAPWSCDVHS